MPNYNKDNGQGFDEDIIKNAFEPYQTSKEHGKGLGLAIVKSIVDEHKGEINIDNSNIGAIIKIICQEQKNSRRY